MEQPEGEGGGDQDGGQVALLRDVRLVIFFGNDTSHLLRKSCIYHAKPTRFSYLSYLKGR